MAPSTKQEIERFVTEGRALVEKLKTVLTADDESSEESQGSCFEVIDEIETSLGNLSRLADEAVEEEEDDGDDDSGDDE